MTPSTTPTPKRLLQHIRLKAPVERVFRALTDADELLKWFPDVATTDCRVGGEWKFEFHHKDGSIEQACGRYLAIEPPQLVSFSWHSTLDDAGTALSNLTIVFRLVPDGDETDLYLEETGYGEGEAHSAMFNERTNGWNHILAGLADLLAEQPQAAR